MCMPATPPIDATGRSTFLIKSFGFSNQKKALSTGSESDLRTGLEQSVSFVCTEHACRERIVGHVLTTCTATPLRVYTVPYCMLYPSGHHAYK